MRVYGIATCDTCRKAMKELATHDPQWHDIRKTPLTPEECAEFFQAFGDKALNRSSTTWRTLGMDEKAEPVLDLLLRHPTLLKRPVIRDGDCLYLGWSAEVRAALLP